jgi:type IV pilus assembly protein PilW
MVAMVIGMFGVLIMMQVLSVSEEQKRTTTSGNDAMNEGIMALYGVQGDVRMAGYDFADIALLGCTLTLRAGVVLNALAPVVINSPNIVAAVADPNTDTLLVSYGNSNGTPRGDVTLAVGNIMQTPTAFEANDWVVVAPRIRPLPCALTLDKVTNVNLGTSSVTLASGAAMGKGDRLFNLGKSFRTVGYAIVNGNLTTCDFTDATKNCLLPGNWASISNNIVSLRAQYGRDTTNIGNPAPAMDGILDSYDAVLPNTPATAACDWSRISALRFALVARSMQFEKPTGNPPVGATIAAPVWDGSAAGNPAGSAASPINLTNDPSWQNYRYKVFETIVPIKNMVFMGVPTQAFTSTPAC